MNLAATLIITDITTPVWRALCLFGLHFTVPVWKILIPWISRFLLSTEKVPDW